MSQASSIPNTGGADASAAATQDALSAKSSQSNEASGTGDAVTLPPKPATSGGDRVALSQKALAEQAEKPSGSNTKSAFRLLLKAGYANVHGWWGKNGRLNYIRKCITDIPKGLIQGLAAGVFVGVGSIIGTARSKHRYPRAFTESFSSSYLTYSRDGLLFFGLWALATDDIENKADSPSEDRSDPHLGDYNMRVFAKGVKESKDTTYTPAKIASFGLGAALGAAVPAVVGLVVFGFCDLGVAAKQALSGGDAQPQPVEPPSTTGDADSVEQASDDGQEEVFM